MNSRLMVVATPAFVLAAAAHPAFAQDESTTVSAGPEYAASSLQATLFGEDYRRVWTTPIEVPLLDLDAYAGGLTPVRRGGGLQTVALRLQGNDGCEYNFRSVNKELTPALPPDARETFIDWVRQDQTSAQLPGAPLVVSVLLEAVGVRHVKPALYVMPDALRLGEFRETFSGLLGTMELHPDEAKNGCPGFADADEVENTEDMLAELEESSSHRLESRAFLTARLVDHLVGDWDRHGGNWRWARYSEDGVHRWFPIPEDRDYAFVDYDGLLLSIARARLNRLIVWDESYPDPFALMANSLDLNERLLSDLSRAAWDSVALSVQARLTDDVLREAVRQLPPEYLPLVQDDLLGALRARRDALAEMASDYYLLLAEAPEIRATDERDRLEAIRLPDGSLEVTLSPLEEGASYFRRTFHPDETREVRVFLQGNDDHAVIRGDGPGRITVRVIGGGGDDVLEDRSRGGVVFYDARGDNRFVTGPATRIDRRPYEPPTEVRAGEDEASGGADGQREAGQLLPVNFRDWGESRSASSPGAIWVSNVGPVLTAGPSLTRYGFRRTPHHYAWNAALQWAPLHTRFGVEAQADIRSENSRRRYEFAAGATQISVNRFHGFGNESPDFDGDGVEVWERLLHAEAFYVLSFSPGGELEIGPAARYVNPQVESGSPAARFDVRGSHPFGALGAIARLGVDRRDSSSYPRRGFSLQVEGSGFPLAWQASGSRAAPVEPGRAVDSFMDIPTSVGAFGTAHAEARGYLTPFGRGPTVALRAGGMQAWGDFPFQEAALVGGGGTLRGYPGGRYRGESSLYGNAELRLPITRAELLVKGTLGVLALADAGRVFYGRQESDRWHSSVGGGLWFSFLDDGYTVHAFYAHGERGALYAGFGFPF